MIFIKKICSLDVYFCPLEELFVANLENDLSKLEQGQYSLEDVSLQGIHDKIHNLKPQKEKSLIYINISEDSIEHINVHFENETGYWAKTKNLNNRLRNFQKSSWYILPASAMNNELYVDLVNLKEEHSKLDKEIEILVDKKREIFNQITQLSSRLK